MTLFERAVDMVIAHRRAVLGVVGALTVLLASQIPKLRVNVGDADSLLPQRNPYVIAQHDIQRTFGGKNLSVVALVPQDGDAYAPASLAAVSRLTRAIRELPGSRNVLSLASPEATYVEATADGIQVARIVEGKAPEPEVVRTRVRKSPLLEG